MPTSLVSALLLHRATNSGGKWDSPVARSELVERFAALRLDVARCKRDVGFSGEDADAVDLAVSEISTELRSTVQSKHCLRLRFTQPLTIFIWRPESILLPHCYGSHHI